MSAIRGRNGTALLAAAIVLVIPLLVWSFSNNPPVNNTGAPGQNHCQTCHTGGLGGGNVSIAFSGGGTNYTPGVPQTVTITVNDPNSTTVNWGFEMTAWEGSTATTPGTFAPASTNVSGTNGTSGSQIFARHSAVTSNTFQVTWTPPAASVYSGPVVFYVGSVAGDGTQADLDSLYQTSHTLTAAATPDFTLTASPTAVSVAAGSSGTSTITSTVSGGFSSAVALSSSGAPTGTTVSFTPTSITGTGTSIMNIAVGATTTPGSYPITVTGTGGGLTHTATVTLTVTAAPNFTLSASPTTVSVAAGGAGTSTITSTVSGGFSSAVALSSSGAPTGTTVSFSPTSITGTGTSIMNIAVGATTTPGSYPITVTGTGGGLTHTATVTLTVTAAANFTLSASPTTVSVAAGGAGTSTITSTVSGGFSSAVALSSSGAPTGTTVSFTPASITGTGTSSMNIAVGATTATGTYPITVTGTGGGITHTATVTLTVTAAANFTLSASPTTVSVAAGSSGTSTITSTVSGGFSSAVALTSSGAPTGTTVSFTPASITGTGTSTMTIAVGASTATGTYPITVTGTGGGVTHTTTVDLTVTSIVTKPALKLTPSTLAYSYQIGGSAPAEQSVAVTSSGAALSFTAATNQTWLTVTPTSGSTPGSLAVAVDPTGLAAGTHYGTVTVTAADAANSPQTVTVALAVTNAGSGKLVASPSTLSFTSGGHDSSDDSSDDDNPLRKSLRVTSTGAPLHFTAEALGGTWLSVGPSAGKTPARLQVTVSPVGLAVGTYVGQIKLSAANATSLSVPVTFTVRSGGGGSHDDSISTTTYTYDPSNSGAVTARWVYGAGVPNSDDNDPTNQGLVLSNNASATSKARAGVIVNNVGGITLNALGFDLRQGSLCSARGPRFIVVTSDSVVHVVGGCSQANVQSAPAKGWSRFRFDPSQATPAIAPESTVKSIALMLDDGPEAGGGMVVLDNINVNGMFIGHD